MDLVVMAAGMGSRFGGLKQVQVVDDDKNFIIDYSVFDAIRAGFDRVIFIIKEENLEIFKSTIGNRIGQSIRVEYVFQKIDNVPEGVKVPEGRVKPWGTAHAIYSVKDIVSDRFAVINADDFYGHQSFKLVADFLKNNKDDEFISAGFIVENTLSDKGSVKRGIFTVKDNLAVDLVESEIEEVEGRIMARPLNKSEWREVPRDTMVSMNMFGFTGKFIDRLKKEFVEFFKKDNFEKEEFYVPQVVNDMVFDGSVKLHVLRTDAKWYGITYKEDLEDFQKAIASMRKNGEYPEHLYKK